MYPSPKCSVPGLEQVVGKWTGGGAATDCALAAGDWSKGIASVAYTAATGVYTVTFTDAYQQLVGYRITASQQTGVDPIGGVVRNGTYSSTTKSLIFELNTLPSGALVDALTTDKLMLEFTFAKFAP